MKSSFLPKYEQKIALTTQGRNPDNYFGRNDDFINSFWNCLTFRALSRLQINLLEIFPVLVYSIYIVLEWYSLQVF